MPTESRPNRDAWIPPPPPSVEPDGDDERARRQALAELAELIGELERWRRRQAMRKPLPGSRWVMVRSRDGVDVRIRFERGRPTQLRTRAGDRGFALDVAAEALEVELSVAGPWQRDASAADWHVSVEVITTG